MKLIKFDDDTYGVRLGWFFGWRYLDLVDQDFKWKMGSRFFLACKQSRKVALAAYNTRRKYDYVEIQVKNEGKEETSSGEG